MKLNSLQMAQFVARGFLRFDAVVPDDINAQFMQEAGAVREDGNYKRVMQLLGEMIATNDIPEVRAGVPLGTAFAPGSALQRPICDIPSTKAFPSTGCSFATRICS